MLRCLPKALRVALIGTALLVPVGAVPMTAFAQVTYAPRTPDQPPAVAAPADPAPAAPSEPPFATEPAPPPPVAVAPAPPATIEPAQPAPADAAPAARSPAAAMPAVETPTPAKVGEVLKDVAKGDVKALRRGPLLIHGNYCGIGNRPGKEPTDALDAACMRHDACTDEHSLPSCACDNRLRREALAIADDPATSAEIKALATTMAASMVVLICK